jgi:2'-5' RNA ligase
MLSHEQPRVRDHWWWRPGWQAGRRLYTWHLTFQGQHELHRLVGAYQDALVLPGLDLVPLEWLHLTMQSVGFTDEVSERQVRQVVAAAEQRCGALARFTLTLGPAQVDQEGVTLPVVPQGPVRWLRMAVRGAVAEVLGVERVPERAERFWPHVSVAYSNANGPAAPIIGRVERVGALRAVATVGQVWLLELERVGHLYRWETLAAVPLGTMAPS